MTHVIVREYARISTGPVNASLDMAQVSRSAFDWLCNLQAGFAKSGASLLQIENQRWLKLDNYVGVLQTPCGTTIEILPKITDEESPDALLYSRNILIKILASALHLPTRSTSKANIHRFEHSLLEWVMQAYIHELDSIVKRGLRFDYQRVEADQRFLRGQLNLNKQLRQPVGREHLFNIRNDVFLPDRPENRLLKSALTRVCQLTQQADTWRLAHELAGMMDEVPNSTDIKSDFQLWRNDRLIAHYQTARPWCELVLSQHMPLAIQGNTRGISLLFPMERLFETFVEKKLRQRVQSPYRLKSQAASRSLCTHEGGHIFQLRPDFLIQRANNVVAVLDTKWKLISSAKRSEKYGLSQSDFYQLFAYGHNYLKNGAGPMLLIYPKTAAFDSSLSEFKFSSELSLWVVPFDLESENIEWPPELSACIAPQ